MRLTEKTRFLSGHRVVDPISTHQLLMRCLLSRVHSSASDCNQIHIIAIPLRLLSRFPHHPSAIPTTIHSGGGDDTTRPVHHRHHHRLSAPPHRPSQVACDLL